MSKYTVTEIRSTNSIGPSSWVGKLDDGTDIYFRYRWGELTIRLNDEVRGEKIFEEQLHDDESRSHLDRMELKEFTSELLTLPY